jgi:trigger factor
VQITVEDLSPIRKKIDVALPPEEVQAEIEHAYRGLQQRARIKGFRPGKVPRPILERYYGEQIQSEVIGKLIQDSYARALEEHSLHAVAQPEIVAEEVRPESGLRYSATIEIKPAFDVAGWDGLVVQRSVAPVTDAEVDEHLERLRQSFAHMVRRDDRDTVEQGDLVELAYTGVVDGRVLPGATSQSRVVEVGSGTFPPPFEDRLVGRRRGESLHVDVPYPAQHHSPEIAGKTVTFRVEIKEIGRKELPALDDEFAKDHGECESLGELRDKIRRGLTSSAERDADERVRGDLLQQLVERNPIDVPDALVERKFQATARDLGIHEARGGTPEQEAELDRIRGELRHRARRVVHSALLLERLAVQQGFEVGDAEVDERIAAIVRAAPRDRERLADLYRVPEARRELRDRMMQEKALTWLAGHATVTPVPHQT